jgi:predicted dienelactone hydrolase
MRNKPKLLAALLVLAAACASRPAGSEVEERHTTIAGREVVVWSSGPASSPRPVVIFSHGFGGCATQSRFLTEALARHGYWVLAPNHRDARCQRGRGLRGARARPEEPFRNPERWTDATYADRAEDVRAILAALADSAELAQQLDLAQPALVGHSLGGYTVLGLAGAWPSWKLPGVRAVLALSPYTEPFLASGTLGGLAAPVMYQGGTRDIGITPALRRPGGAYDASPAPRYFVEFDGAGHFAWTDLNAAAHDGILHYALAFLDHHVRGGPGTPLTRAIDGVSELRHESGPAPGAGAPSPGR